jgi:hypothetical protein
LAKAKTRKTQNVNRTTMKKQVGSLIPKVKTTAIIINNHMVVIQI